MIFNSARTIESICGMEMSQEDFDQMDEKYVETEIIEEAPQPVLPKSPIRKKRSR